MSKNLSLSDQELSTIRGALLNQEYHYKVLQAHTELKLDTHLSNIRALYERLAGISFETTADAFQDKT